MVIHMLFQKKYKKAITLTEVMIVTGLFCVLMTAAYRLFFSEVKTIKTALEHIGVNESARKFFAFMGSDVRNSNWIDFPKMVNRQVVGSLKPVKEGKVLVLRKQVMDFDVKPPQSDFIKEEIVTYTLKKAEDGTSDLYRHVVSELPGQPSKDYEKKIADGIVDLLVFVTNRKPMTIEKTILSGSLEKIMNYEPYELDGTGPYLVHICCSFSKKGSKEKEVKTKESLIKINTCFSVRGKLNGIHP